MITYSAKPDEVKRDWYVIDATDKTLGRIATEIGETLLKFRTFKRAIPREDQICGTKKKHTSRDFWMVTAV